jgi:hypothetical protein
MPIPETIPLRFTEEDAGYVTVRPVIRQTFRISELTDMVVSVTGKSTARVQQIFRSGTVVYNGFRYWWEGFAANESEIAALLEPFPDDDLSRPFNSAEVASVSLEIGGGTQRSLLAISQQDASTKKLFAKLSPWQILLGAANNSTPRYEKYSHADRADIFRLHLPLEQSASLLQQLLASSPRSLHKKMAVLQPPAAILFFSPRRN